MRGFLSCTEAQNQPNVRDFHMLLTSIANLGCGSIVPIVNGFDE